MSDELKAERATADVDAQAKAILSERGPEFDYQPKHLRSTSDAGGGVRESVAQRLACAHSAHALTAYRAGAGPAVEYWNKLADAALSNSAAADSNASAELEDARAEAADSLRTLDAIAEYVGCPHDEELTVDHVRTHYAKLEDAAQRQGVEDANRYASAEARLRGALENLIGSSEAFLNYFNPFNLASDKENQWLSVHDDIGRARKALSPDPHASDCEKQGLPPIDESLHTPEVVASLQTTAMRLDDSDCEKQKDDDWDGLDCGCGGGWKVGHLAGCPSDRPADVTVEELRGWLVRKGVIFSSDMLARALLDAFTVGRR